MLKALIRGLLLVPTLALAAGGSSFPLEKAPINLRDQASLQRGAKWYMNYCAGCHSLKYQRYKRLAKDIGITDHYGDILTDIVTNNLIFTGAKIGDTIQVAMNAEDAKSWFGITPPDLTLVARVRGSDWLYTYLHSFYDDNSKPWGSNNALFPDVGMPNVLVSLQGEQVPVYETEVVSIDGQEKTIKHIKHLQLIKEGKMNQHQFDVMVADLVNFLSYVGEPVKLVRYRLGFLVIGFLLILLVLSYLLKKEFWKDVHK